MRDKMRLFFGTMLIGWALQLLRKSKEPVPGMVQLCDGQIKLCKHALRRKTDAMLKL